ncbi:hypothetical protein M0804_008785 [Polistes exclamans]|nr:hypothetical protein M0804_008785 [Polistes exclamans]
MDASKGPGLVQLRCLGKPQHYLQLSACVLSSVPINHLAHGPAIRLLEEGVIILPDSCDARPPWVQYWTLSPFTFVQVVHENFYGVLLKEGRKERKEGRKKEVEAEEEEDEEEEEEVEEEEEEDTMEGNIYEKGWVLRVSATRRNCTARYNLIYWLITEAEQGEPRARVETNALTNGGSSSCCIQPIRVSLERGHADHHFER